MKGKLTSLHILQGLTYVPTCDRLSGFGLVSRIRGRVSSVRASSNKHPPYSVLDRACSDKRSLALSLIRLGFSHIATTIVEGPASWSIYNTAALVYNSPCHSDSTPEASPGRNPKHMATRSALAENGLARSAVSARLQGRITWTSMKPSNPKAQKASSPGGHYSSLHRGRDSAPADIRSRLVLLFLPRLASKSSQCCYSPWPLIDDGLSNSALWPRQASGYCS
ncbi:hypothetical protein GGR56DRAFT_351148 [Xylariaceae sp. FL0804]|nr:hypothetical protein GGR56DRAFT_351148 [Xylariaceae sp. FL0804]